MPSAPQGIYHSRRDHLKFMKFHECLLELNSTFLWQWGGAVEVSSPCRLFAVAWTVSGIQRALLPSRHTALLCRPQRIRRRKSFRTQRESKTFKGRPLLFIILSHYGTTRLFPFLDCPTLHQHVIRDFGPKCSLNW